VVRPLTRRLLTIATAGAAMTILMSGPTPALAATAVAGTVSTGSGPLNVRGGAGTGHAVLYQVANGSALSIQCQITGQSISGNVRSTNLWDRVGAGAYVADAYVQRNTSVAIADCSAPTPPVQVSVPTQQAAPRSGKVSTDAGGLNIRLGASTGYSVVGQLPNGVQMTVYCQVAGGQINGYVRSTNLWDKIAPNKYVSDAYVVRNTALPIPVCAATPMGNPPPGVMGAWVAPVPGVVGQPFRPSYNPHHDGVDIMEPRNTPILSASDGTVITMECNTSGPSCNVDGSSSVRGCGWYVEVQHPGQVITRYCHMVRRPEVVVGQHVSTGQVLGYVGTSGNSSGTHLHFETHVGGSQADSSNAVDPVAFMRSVRAPLAGT
jgi:murein DD-endopeptidase MepM/ murein hydrolase activator NlpD